MKRCRRIGQDVTKRCNAACKTCFYRYAPDFNKDYDVPIKLIREECDRAKARGCNHSVLVGWGETTLYKYLEEWQAHCDMIGFTTSMITNGMCSVKKAAEVYALGLDHLHISVHGTGDILNQILERDGASRMQGLVIEMLKREGHPWRSNTTLQKINYEHLAETAKYVVEHGCRHVVLLGFLPHYEWRNRLREVAVHPAILRPHIEEAAEVVLDAGAMLTIRYHPMCHLRSDYWKYVVNAQYVLYDPWEWDYGHAGDSKEALWSVASNEIGGGVAIKGEPCSKCDLKMHCGGWNKIYAAGFEGAGLKAQKETDVPFVPGWLHDLNPANKAKGYFRENSSDN